MPQKGLIMVHTGTGKGKTTAALGTAFRALGYGWKILMVQFIKGNWHYGELDAAKKFGDQLQILPMGEGFTWDVPDDEKQKLSGGHGMPPRNACTLTSVPRSSTRTASPVAA